MRRSRIVRMDDWDKPKGGWSHKQKLCDLRLRVRVVKCSGSYCISFFKVSREGTPVEEIKSEAYADTFCKAALDFIRTIIHDTTDWAIITTPARRHLGGYHFASDICRKIAEAGEIKYYENAIQTINKDRINPSFFLLRPIKERNIILYDDIITTGMTMKASKELLYDKNVLCLVGINNR